MWAVIPLKDFVHAKGRLAGILNMKERQLLLQAMVEDIVQTLQQTPSISGILLISDDPTVAMLANRYRVELIPEDRGAKGLNAAVTHAARWLQSRDITSIMVLHGDVPLATSDDLERLIQAHQQQSPPAVTIVGDSRQQGSNCLLCSPPTVIQFCYGPDSFSQHQAAAVASGAQWQALAVPSLALDIDTPADLPRLLDELARNPDYHNRHTYAALFKTELASRLRALAGEANWSKACEK